jgi:hypothetical protein
MTTPDDETERTLDLARVRADAWYRRWREAAAELERLERAAGIRAGEAGSVRAAEDDGECDEAPSLEGIFRAPGDVAP